MSGLRPNSFFLDRVLSVRHQDDILIDCGGIKVSGRDLEHFSVVEDRSLFAGRNVMVTAHESMMCALALLDLDGVASRIVVCPPLLPKDHLQAIAAAAKIDFVLGDELPEQHPSNADFISLKKFKRLRNESELTPQETEWVLLTSGTTGVPKMVRHTFGSLTINIRRPDTKGAAITWASFNDMRRFSGLQMFLHALLTDSTLVLKPVDVSVGDFLPVLAQAGATHVSGTPTHWRKVLMFEDRGKLKLQQVTLVGEIADQPILDALKTAFPAARLTHIYGSTESGTGFSVHDGKAGFPAEFVGRDLKGLELKVQDGMLKVRSNRAAKDYVGDTPVNLRDSEGFVDTGDQVQLEVGRYKFLGRKNGAVNIGGSRVHPEEVEALLNAHPQVSMSVVSAKKNPFTGAILVADVVLKNHMEVGPEDREALGNKMLAELRLQLEPYKVPASIRFVNDLKLSAAGKLERKSA